jgi:hypothetical protein
LCPFLKSKHEETPLSIVLIATLISKICLPKSHNVFFGIPDNIFCCFRIVGQFSNKRFLIPKGSAFSKTQMPKGAGGEPTNPPINELFAKVFVLNR